MNFLSPIAGLVAAGIAVPALVLLYFLKLRRRQVVVSSTLLWKRAVHDMEVNSPFQKLRKNLLLLLQLLILAALLFAFARPTFRGSTQPGKQMVIVIDHSASMNATDVGPSRLGRAKQMALALVEDLQGAAMVVSFAGRAQVRQAFTSDRALLRDAIRSIQPTDEDSSLTSAMHLVEAPALEAANRDITDTNEPLQVHVFSDGRTHETDGRPASLAGAQLIPYQIGSEQADNLAIVSLSARRDFKKPQIVQLFATVANYSTKQIKTNLTLRLDGQVQRVVPVTVPAAPPSTQQSDGSTRFSEPGRQSVQFDLVLSGSAMVNLSHNHSDDLAADDSASLTIAPPRRLRVLLVSAGNPFLDLAIEATGVRRLVHMSGKKFENQDPLSLQRGGWLDDAGGSEVTGFDVIIFDNYSPKSMPLVNSLYLGGVPPLENLTLQPPREDAPKTQLFLDWQRDHPLLRYVALDDILFTDADRLTLPDTALTLATGLAGPVIAEVSHEGVRHIVSSFDILNSNWPAHYNFPVLISNAIEWLGLGGQTQAGIGYLPGQVAMVPLSGEAQQMRYDGPDGLTLTAELRGGTGQAVLPMFRRVGVYEAADAISPPWDRLAVNLLDTTESDLRPATQLRVGTLSAQAVSQSAVVRREVWHWFVWAALAVMLLEWLVYTRRMNL